MKHTLTGDWESKIVYLDGKRLNPRRSQAVFNHSPDGFNYGYEGSGPAQLALAIMLELMPERAAVRLYQDFKRVHIATLPRCNFNYEFNI